MEAMQLAQVDTAALETTATGDAIDIETRCSTSPYGTTCTTWQPHHGITFASASTSTQTHRSGMRSFSSSPSSSIGDSMWRDVADERNIAETARRAERAKEQRHAEEMARMRLAIAAAKAEKERPTTELIQKHEQEVIRLRNDIAAERRHGETKLQQQLNAKQSEFNTQLQAVEKKLAQTTANIETIVANRVREAFSQREAALLDAEVELRKQTTRVEAAEKGLMHRENQLKSARDRLTADGQALGEVKASLDQRENTYESVLIKKYETRVALAARGHAARKEQRKTYPELRQPIHIQPRNAALQLISERDGKLSSEIAMYKRYLQAAQEQGSSSEDIGKLEQYLTVLENAWHDIHRFRGDVSTPLHYARNVLRHSAFPPAYKYPLSLERAINMLDNSTLDVTQDMGHRDGLSDGALWSGIRQLKSLKNAVWEQRLCRMLANEEIEIQLILAPEPDEFRRLTKFIVGDTPTGLKNQAKFFALAEQRRELQLKEAELVVLKKLVGRPIQQEEADIRAATENALQKGREILRSIQMELGQRRLAQRLPRSSRPLPKSIAPQQPVPVAKSRSKRRSERQRPSTPFKRNPGHRVLKLEKPTTASEASEPQITATTTAAPKSSTYTPDFASVEHSKANTSQASTSAKVPISTTYTPEGAPTEMSKVRETPVRSTYSPEGASTNVSTPANALTSSGTRRRRRQRRQYSTNARVHNSHGWLSYPLHTRAAQLDCDPLIIFASSSNGYGASQQESEWESIHDQESPRTASTDDRDQLGAMTLSGSLADLSIDSSVDCDSVVSDDEPSLPTLTYHISDQALADAQAADLDTTAAAWSFRLYKNAAGDGVSLHFYSNIEKAETAAASLLTEPVLGFDLEWEEYSKPGKHEIKRCISMLQLANEKGCHLFHIALFKGSTADELMPQSLRKLLTSPNVIKAGVNVAGDSNRIKTCFGIEMQGTFELSHMYKLVLHGQNEPEKVDKKLVRLAEQVQQHLLLPLPKGEVRTSRWSAKLEFAQLEYAASDAYAGFQLFHALDQKRRALEPMPPRPAFWELRLPIELADGTFAKSVSATKKNVSTTIDEEGDEFYDALEYQEDDRPEADAEQAKPIAKEDKIKTSRPSSVELDLANAWIEDWMGARPSGSKSSLTAAPLRAYHLWHVQGFEIEQTAALLRQPPILSTTVASYIADAVSRGQLTYDAGRLKAAMQVLPKTVHGRYRGLISKLDMTKS